ncbi:hypothetical protein D3C87_1974310 [compost metagenome]
MPEHQQIGFTLGQSYRNTRKAIEAGIVVISDLVALLSIDPKQDCHQVAVGWLAAWR